MEEFSQSCCCSYLPSMVLSEYVLILGNGVEAFIRIWYRCLDVLNKY